MFKNSQQVNELTIKDLVQWRIESINDDIGNKSRLLLPPIQRSLVWNNEKIIHFWDSLFRAYPAGMMLVHQAKQGGKGYGPDGRIDDAFEADYQLFDGQQRLAAILLGFGLGPLAAGRQLWVDLGSAPSSDLLWCLRMNSQSQPCGYQIANPNNKYSLAERRDWHEQNKSASEWKKGPLLGSKKCISLAELIAALNNPAHMKQIRNTYQAEHAAFDAFVKTLREALNRRIVIQQLEADVVNDADQYLRLFQRIGQGGVALTDKELTYSIIKNQFPKIRIAAEEIAANKVAGRLIDEVDLVLACLRVAKLMMPSKKQESWEFTVRPNPQWVKKLREDDFQDTKKFFEEFFNGSDEKLALKLIREIRTAIQYSADNQLGLPTILLGNLPHELFDVLLLWAQYGHGTINKDLMCRFTVYWLIFVHNNDKAALQIYADFRDKKVAVFFNEAHIQQLIATFEAQDWAYHIAQQNELTELEDSTKNFIPENQKLLREYAQRFIASDKGERRPGEFLRSNSGMNNPRLRRILMWLQREYLSSNDFSNYDPTLSGDQDLPVDLDHLIPFTTFQFRWDDRWTRLEKTMHDDNNIRYQRSPIGNSLGNFRWLKAENNRSRQDGPIDLKESTETLLTQDAQTFDAWNALIDKKTWEQRDILDFQKFIDLRTLNLYRILLIDLGFNDKPVY
jgi:hypothetical protein